MLEGLEISEIQLSKLDHIKNRLDSEYYQKKYLLIDSKIKAVGETDLLQIGTKLDCSAFYPSITEYYDFEGSGIPFLRVNEIKNGLVKITENTAYLPKHILDNNKSTIAVGYPGDMVIAKGGNTLAKVGLITSQYEKYALSRDIILVRTSEMENYNKYFLWLFMHSDIGQSLLWRTASQTGQPHLTLPSLNEIKLPKYKTKFESIAEKLYKQSVDLYNHSKYLYSQAETLLLETLGLKDFEPSKEPVNIKSFTASFGSSGRLDAEYYQKKYDDLEAKLLRGKHQKLCDYFKLLSNPSPKSYDDYGTKVIKTKNIRIPSVEIKDITDHTNEKCLKVKKDDLLFASMGVGSLGRLSYIDNEIDNCTIDGTIKIFRVKDKWKNKNVEIPIMLFLTSKYGQELIYKYVIGSTGIISISKENIENLLVPVFNETDLNEMNRLVIESISLKKQSEQLLEIAKTAVEKAIEENETVAMAYIHEELKKMEVELP